MDTKGVVIRALDEDTSRRYISDILSIDNLSLGHYKFWYKQNFFLNLPKKWVLSQIALLNNAPIGYCIVSTYSNKKAHIHRMSIHPKFRRAGIGNVLMRHVFMEAFREGVVDITLESLCDNRAASLFYEKIGFGELGEDEVNKYLVEKDKLPKSNKYYVINNKGNRRVFSIKVNNFNKKNNVNKIEAK